MVILIDIQVYLSYFDVVNGTNIQPYTYYGTYPNDTDVAVTPPSIAGYEPLQSIYINNIYDMGGGKYYFVLEYRPITAPSVNVAVFFSYWDAINGVNIQPATFFNILPSGGSLNLATPSISGYIPIKDSYTVTIPNDGTGQFYIIFEYRPIKPVPFKFSTDLTSGKNLSVRKINDTTYYVYTVSSTEWNSLQKNVNDFETYKKLTNTYFAPVSYDTDFSASTVQQVINAINRMTTVLAIVPYTGGDNIVQVLRSIEIALENIN